MHWLPLAARTPAPPSHRASSSFSVSHRRAACCCSLKQARQGCRPPPSASFAVAATGRAAAPLLAAALLLAAAASPGLPAAAPPGLPSLSLVSRMRESSLFFFLAPFQYKRLVAGTVSVRLCKCDEGVLGNASLPSRWHLGFDNLKLFLLVMENITIVVTDGLWECTRAT